MSLTFLTETLSVIDSNSGSERHGCFRLSTSWTEELLDVSVIEGLVASSVRGECSRELLEALSMSDGMMVDGVRSGLGDVEWF
jgi:hypothetical protein